MLLEWVCVSIVFSFMWTRFYRDIRWLMSPLSLIIYTLLRHWSIVSSVCYFPTRNLAIDDEPKSASSKKKSKKQKEEQQDEQKDDDATNLFSWTPTKSLYRIIAINLLQVAFVLGVQHLFWAEPVRLFRFSHALVHASWHRVLMLVIISPFKEEVFFRGIVLFSLAQNASVRSLALRHVTPRSWALQAGALFGVYHLINLLSVDASNDARFTPPYIALQVGSGFVAGTLFSMHALLVFAHSRSIWLALGHTLALHIFNNAVAIFAPVDPTSVDPVLYALSISLSLCISFRHFRWLSKALSSKY
jgi:Type II CAAX prenyl endopeptidase Rce1-like